MFVKLPLKGRPGENLLVWTTTPWTLTSNVGAAVNPELTYLKVKLKARSIRRQGRSINRMESAGDDEGEPRASRRQESPRDWLDGVPHLQDDSSNIFKESRQGRVRSRRGQGLNGRLEYVGPFDDLPAQQHAFGFPEEVAKIVQQGGWCQAITAAAAHRVDFRWRGRD